MRAFVVLFPLAFVAILCGIAVVGIQLHRASPGKIDYPRLACRFDAFCDGSDCNRPLPADFRNTPKGRFDRADLAMDGRPSRLSGRRGGAVQEYVSSANDIGIVTIRIAGDGTMTFEKQRGNGDPTVVTTGHGHCRAEVVT